MSKPRSLAAYKRYILPLASDDAVRHRPVAAIQATPAILDAEATIQSERLLHEAADLGA